MSKIPHIIPKQRFELLRDRIGEILKSEFAKQVELSGDQNINVNVWGSRILQFKNNELPAINIVHSGSDFSNKDNRNADNECTFFIEVSVSNINPANEVDNKSLLVRDKINGIIRYILEHPEYKTFLFPPPFIKTSIVQSIQNAEIGHITDTDYTVMSRITLNVTTYESVTPIDARQLESSITNVKINETNQGYRYELINT